jgi:hypothetical protein
LQYAQTRNKHFTQEGREKTLTAIMRVLLLKRLESSINAFTLTLARTLSRVDALLGRIEQHEKLATDNPEIDLGAIEAQVLAGDDEEIAADLARALEVGSKLKYRLPTFG